MPPFRARFEAREPRSIFLFGVLLSVALSEIPGAWPVVITTLCLLPFLLLEKTATHMQDPFANRPTDTPVTAIAWTIEINLLQLLEEDQAPSPLEADGFFLR